MKWKPLVCSLLAALLLLGGFAGCKKEQSSANTSETQAILLPSKVNTAASSAGGTTAAGVPATTRFVTAARTSTQPNRVTTPPAAQRQTTGRNKAEPTSRNAGASAKPPSNQPVTTPPKAMEEAYEAEILRLVNQERAKAGLTPLRRSATLASAAMIRTKEIQIKWSHERPDGSDCFSVSDEVYGENLAYGFSTAKQAMNAWMTSPGHRENIMRPQFRTLGVGQQNGYWVQLFGY